MQTFKSEVPAHAKFPIYIRSISLNFKASFKMEKFDLYFLKLLAWYEVESYKGILLCLLRSSSLSRDYVYKQPPLWTRFIKLYVRKVKSLIDWLYKNNFKTFFWVHTNMPKTFLRDFAAIESQPRSRKVLYIG